MPVLLDECVPRRLRVHISGHDVRTVHDLGLVGLRNGVLLRRAAMAGVEAFITVDRSLQFQVNVRTMPFGILLLQAHSNDIDVLQRLTPQITAALNGLQAGRLVRVSL